MVDGCCADRSQDLLDNDSGINREWAYIQAIQPKMRWDPTPILLFCCTPLSFQQAFQQNGREGSADEQSWHALLVVPAPNPLRVLLYCAASCARFDHHVPGTFSFPPHLSPP